jgi:hypothetical protein
MVVVLVLEEHTLSVDMLGVQEQVVVAGVVRMGVSADTKVNILRLHLFSLQSYANRSL